MIALSASTLVNAGPEPLDLFGVSDWREGCPTLRRHDHGNSPVRPMTVDAPLPPAPQIGPFVGQMQHTNDNCLRSVPAAPFWTPSKIENLSCCSSDWRPFERGRVGSTRAKTQPRSAANCLTAFASRSTSSSLRKNARLARTAWDGISGDLDQVIGTDLISMFHRCLS